MSDPRILVSGDYWHADFRDVIGRFDVPVTLAPIDRLQSLADRTFDLVVLAQSRPDQIGCRVVEEIRDRFPLTPIVGLLGSWCEGSSRSGTPMPGVRRVYFHQWSGQFQNFVRQFQCNGITDWHQPATATSADQVLATQSPDNKLANGRTSSPVDQSATVVIGVSATSHDQFSNLRDAIGAMDWQVCRLDQAAGISATTPTPACLCVDGNSESEPLRERIVSLRKNYPQVPMVLVLNFPRSQTAEMAAEFGVREIVSKPFDLANLKLSLERAMYLGVGAAPSTASKPTPHAWQAKRTASDSRNSDP